MSRTSFSRRYGPIIGPSRSGGNTLGTINGDGDGGSRAWVTMSSYALIGDNFKQV
jgi:hypothetical protein